MFALASGAPGVELILPLMHDAIGERGLPLGLLVRLLCEAPARRFGLWPQKGGLVPGADADLVIFDRGAAGSSTRPRSSLRRAGARTPGGACGGAWGGRSPAGRRSSTASAVLGESGAGRAREAGHGWRSGPMLVLARELRCRGWRQEVILRLLENVLELAERPDDLVVYAAHAKAARDWESLRANRGRARDPGRRRDPGGPVRQADRRAAPRATAAPLVLMANGNLVGRFATPESFYELERAGLVTWGGLTAGAWQYIGAQGVIQGTYETFAAVAREHFAGDLRGRLVVSAGARRDGLGAAAGGGRDARRGRSSARRSTRTSSSAGAETASSTGSPRTSSEALSWARAAAAERRALSVGVAVNAVELLEQLVARAGDPRRGDRSDRRP